MGWAYLWGDSGSVRRFALLFLCASLFSIAYFAFAIPSISFVPPTLNDSATAGFNWVFVNVTSTEPLNQSLLEWGNQSGYFNLSMLNSSPTNWFLNVSSLPDGAYNYTVWAQNTTGDWNQTGRRFVYSDTTLPYSLYACQDLTIENGSYVLAQDVSSAGTCFTIKANNVTLNGQGFLVNFSQGPTAGYGVSDLGEYDNIVIKNLNLWQGNRSLATYGIRSAGMSNSAIVNNTISVSGSGGAAIFLSAGAGSSSNNITGNSITISGSSVEGIYVQGAQYSYISNNIVSGGLIGIHLQSGSNTVLNNTVSSPPYAVYIQGASNNNITGGSISGGNSEYYITTSGASNTFSNTNFVGQHNIVIDATSWFNYNNGSDSVWLKTGLVSGSWITRTLTTWSQAVMRWNDTNKSAGMTALYNLTGLLPNNVYKVYTTSGGVRANPYNITASPGGSVNFTVALNGNTEIAMNADDLLPTVILNSPQNGSSQKSALITFNCTAYDDMNLASVTLYNDFGGAWAANGTNSSGANNAPYLFDRIAPSSGTFEWNCLAYDNASQSGFAPQNFLITVDIVPPTSNSPGDASFSQGSSPTLGWILYDNYAGGHYAVYRNGTMQNQSIWANNTVLNVWVNTSVLGVWNYTIAYNDSLGNEGVPDEVAITIVGEPTVITQSPLNQTYAQNWVWANLTTTAPVSWCGVSLNGAANQAMSNASQTAWYTNLTVPSEGSNNVVFYCNTTSGSMGNSSTAYFTIDTIAPNITSWYANGANASSPTDVMFLVGTAESVLFNVTVVDNTTLAYRWLVNKIDQNQNSNNLTFTVPACDHVNDLSSCIWEIYLTVNDSAGHEAYKEWVVSNLSVAEAPVLFDSFTDGKYNSRTDTDPWGRALTNWTSTENAFAISAFYMPGDAGKTYHLRASSSVVYGTWDFYFRFPNGGNSNYADAAEVYYASNGTSDFSECYYRWIDPSDEHVWNDYICNGNKRYPLSYVDQDVTGSNSGCISNDTACQSTGNIGIGPGWHHVRIINDKRTGFQWNWIGLESVDEPFIPESMEYMDYLKTSKYFGIRTLEDGSLTDGVYSVTNIDDVSIYNETYLYPAKKAIYNATHIILKNGLDPSSLWSFEYISALINNGSVFSYNATTRTAYINVDNFVLDWATGFGMDNQTLVFNSSSPAWLWKSGNYIRIVNSRVYGSRAFFTINTFPSTSLRGMSSTSVLHSGYIDLISSNFTNVYGPKFSQSFDWMDHVNISNNYFLFNKTYTGSGVELGFSNSNYAYDILNNNNTFDMAQGAQQQAASEGMIRMQYGYPYFYNPVFKNNVGFYWASAYPILVNPDISGARLYPPSVGTNGTLKTKYYADILVNDIAGNNLSGALVSITNEVNDSISDDIENLTLPQDHWYWYDNPGGTVGYHRKVTFDADNEANTFTTGSNGHTPLPTWESNTVVLEAYQRNDTYQANYTYTLSAYDPNNIWTNITHTIYPNGTIQQLQPLAQVTGVSPDPSWYRPTPNTYQNTTVLQINYTRTNISVNANQNATNITVTRWNTSLSQGQVLVNFTAESVGGNNVNFTVCSLTATKTYAIKKDGAAFASKTADSSGCVWFNNSVWTSHVFTMEEQSQGPSGCSAINAAFYDASSNTIFLNNQTSTLCTLYYDVNNVSVLSYASNNYTLNSNLTIKGDSSLLIENTTLRFNATSDGALVITLGKQYGGNGTFTARNATITSVNGTARGSIYSTSETGGYGFANITNSTLAYIYKIEGSNGKVEIRDSTLRYVLWWRNGGPARNVVLEFFDTPWGDGGLYGVSSIDNAMVRNNIVSGAYGMFYVAYVTNSEAYGLDIGINSALAAKEQSTSGIFSGNTIYNLVGSGSAISTWLSDVYAYSSATPFVITDNRVTNISSGKGIYVSGKVWVNVANNTVNNSGRGLSLDRLKNNFTSKNNRFRYNDIGIHYDGDSWPNVSIVSVNDDFSNSTSYDIQLGQFYATTVYTPKFINAKYNLSKTLLNGRLYDYKYLDVQVIDAAGTPISNAVVNITSLDDASYPSIDINGANKTSVNTSSDGHTYLPDGNEHNSIAVLAFWKTSSTQQNMTYSLSAYDPSTIWTNVTHTIYPDGTIEQLQPLAQVSGVNPDSSWYRSNPNTYQNTTVLQINYTSTNITVNANQNATNITVTKWNTSLPQGQIIVNFTAESVDGNNVNFTVCSLTATKNYTINRDGSSFVVKTADSSGCILFNNSVWTAHIFTIEEQSSCTGICYVAADGTGDYTTDGSKDQVEINQALLRINSTGGGTVHIKSGTYLVNESIYVYSNTVFEGDNLTSVIRLDGTNRQLTLNLITNADQTNGNRNITIRNALIDGNRANDPYHVSGTNGSNAIYLKKVDLALVSGINITGTTLDGIYFYQSSNSTVDSVNVYDIGHDAYRLDSGSVNITVQNSYAKSTDAHCVRFYNSDNSAIKNSRLISCGDRGIYMNAGGIGSVDDNLIQNNTINTANSSAFEGIYLDNSNYPTSTMAGTVIQNNVLYSIFSHGIRLKNVTDTRIVSNTINRTISANTDGILAEGSGLSNNSVRNTIIIGAARNGINGTIASTYNLIWLNGNSAYGGNVQNKTGDIYADPLFANPAAGDFHLKSQAGRWNGTAWVLDSVTSPAIDAGDPADAYSLEPQPNGNRINMGAYGGTAEASKSYYNQYGGRDWYVATWGNNSNPGTLDSPKKNFNNSDWFNSTNVKPGDIFYLIDGTWFNESIVLPVSGNATHPITITAYNGTPTLEGGRRNDGGACGGDWAVKDACGIYGDNFTYLGPSGSSYINIIGLTFTNWMTGIRFNNGANVTVVSVHSYNNTDGANGYGLGSGNGVAFSYMANSKIINSVFSYNDLVSISALHSSNITIDNNSVIDTELLSDYGIATHYSDHITISNNRVHAANHGIALRSATNYSIIENNTITDSWENLEVKEGSYGNIVRNNTLNCPDVRACDGIDLFGNSYTNLVYSNTFELYGFGKALKIFNQANDDSQVYNNIIRNGLAGAPGVQIFNASGTTLRNNTFVNFPSSSYLYLVGWAGSLVADINIINDQYVNVSSNVYFDGVNESDWFRYVSTSNYVGTIGTYPTTHYTDNSTIIYTGGALSNLHWYNMAARPSSGYAIITTDGVNLTSIQTDLSGMPSPKVWNMTIWSTYSNTTATFNLSTGLSSRNFSLFRDGSLYANLTTNATGGLNYKYSGGGFGTLAFSFQEQSTQTFDNDPSTFWVRTDGNDTCSGQNNVSFAQNSTDCAWANVSKAGTSLTAGQVVRVQTGTYYNNPVTVSSDGNSSNWITITADGMVTLDGQGGGTAFTITSRDYLAISGFRIQNYADGIFGFAPMTNVNLTNLIFENMSGDALDIRSGANDKFNLAGITIRNTTGHGMYLQDIHNSALREINVSDTTGAGKSCVYIEDTNHTVLNRVRTENCKWSGIQWQGFGGSYYNLIDNSTVIYAEHSGIDIHNNNSHNIIRNSFVRDIPSGSIGIYIHNEGNVNNTCDNCTVYNATTIAYLLEYNTNVTLKNSVAYGSGTGLEIRWGNNHLVDTFNAYNNTKDINIRKNDGIYPYGNNTFANSNFTTVTYTNISESDSIIDPANRNYSIHVFTDTPEIKVRYTQGTIFTEDGPNTPFWFSDESNMTLDAIGTTTFTRYLSTLNVTGGNVTVTSFSVSGMTLDYYNRALPFVNFLLNDSVSGFNITLLNVQSALNLSLYYSNGTLISTQAPASTMSFNRSLDDGSYYVRQFSASLPTVSLDFPSTPYLTNNATIPFNCSASSGSPLVNITLYGNWSSGWHANETGAVGGTSNSSVFTKTIMDGSYNWNCLAFDSAGNYSFAAANYTFTIDTIPPATITNLRNQSVGDSWIFWNWTNPASDFDHAEVYLNGTWLANTSDDFYNATGLNASVWYQLSVRTVDAAGNVNGTWVNSSAKTLSDITPPSITIIRPENTTYNYNASLPLNFSISEPASWCGYSLDGAPNVTIPSCLNATFNVSTGGPHSLSLYANDTSGNMNFSVVYFSVDMLAPIVSNVSSGSITSSSAIIVWNTNELADSTVFYVSSVTLGSNKTNTSLTYYHPVFLDGLSGSTQYYYNVSSCDAVGNCNISGQYFFTTASTSTTPPNPPPSGGSQPALSAGGTKSVLSNLPFVRVAVALRGELSHPSLVVTMPPVVPVVSPSGLVYQYLNFTKSGFNNSDIANATIEFKVNTSWITKESITQVYLARYSTGWTKLRTELVNSTGTYTAYRAYTTGFSYFAILGEQAVSSQVELPPVVNETPRFVVPNRSVVTPILVTRQDIEAVIEYLNSVAPQTQKARELLGQARLKLDEAQSAFDQGEQELARDLLREARTLGEEAATLKAAVAVDKSDTLTILLILTALMLAGYAYYTRSNMEN